MMYNLVKVFLLFSGCLAFHNRNSVLDSVTGKFVIDREAKLYITKGVPELDAFFQSLDKSIFGLVKLVKFP